jgi:hypothetical protein
MPLPIGFGRLREISGHDAWDRRRGRSRADERTIRMHSSRYRLSSDLPMSEVA